MCELKRRMEIFPKYSIITHYLQFAPIIIASWKIALGTKCHHSFIVQRMDVIFRFTFFSNACIHVPLLCHRFNATVLKMWYNQKIQESFTLHTGILFWFRHKSQIMEIWNESRTKTLQLSAEKIIRKFTSFSKEGCGHGHIYEIFSDSLTHTSVSVHIPFQKQNREKISERGIYNEPHCSELHARK